MSNIYQLLSTAMTEVGAVHKGERNTQQGFNFRGIDSVVNAVSPVFRKLGIVVFPTVMESDYTTVTIGSKGTQMGHCRVKVAYTFAGPDGTFVQSVVIAESMDSGDKATAKAMSVAFRTALLQTLCLPTDETDPDAESFERTPVAPGRATVPAKSVSASAPRASIGSAARKPDAPGAGLSSSQRIWVAKQAQKLGRGESSTVAVVSEILGREINDLSEVTADEVRTLLPAMSDRIES